MCHRSKILGLINIVVKDRNPKFLQDEWSCWSRLVAVVCIDEYITNSLTHIEFIVLFVVQISHLACVYLLWIFTQMISLGNNIKIFWNELVSLRKSELLFTEIRHKLYVLELLYFIWNVTNIIFSSHVFLYDKITKYIFFLVLDSYLDFIIIWITIITRKFLLFFLFFFLFLFNLILLFHTCRLIISLMCWGLIEFLRTKINYNVVKSERVNQLLNEFLIKILKIKSSL